MTDRIGINVNIVGYAASDARNPAYDKDGSKGVKEISIPLNEGYTKDGEFIQTGTSWYTYSAAGDYAAEVAKVKKGDKVKVEDAKLEVRPYKDKDDNEKLGLNLRYGKLTILESKSGGASSAASSDDSW